MLISDKASYDISCKFLICSIYTIFEYSEFSKKFNFKEDIYLDVNQDSYVETLKSFRKFYLLLNKSSVRNFGNSLVKPIIKSNQNSLSSFFFIKNKEVAEEIYNDITLLKIYLRKFKYNYRRHFSYQNGKYRNLYTNSEINIFAIHLLFLIAGI